MSILKKCSFLKFHPSLILLLTILITSNHILVEAVFVAKDNEFCTLKSLTVLNCNFAKTDQLVELSSVDDDIQDIKLEAITAFSGRLPNGTNLGFWSSSNITLYGYGYNSHKEAVSLSIPETIPSQNSSHSGNGRHDTKESVTEGIAIIFPDHDQSSKSNNPTDPIRPSGDDFMPSNFEGFQHIGNVSLHLSDIHEISGNFSFVSVHSSTLKNVSGSFKSLIISKRSTISLLTVTGIDVNIEESDIEQVNQIRVMNNLQLKRGSISRISYPGILIQQLSNNPSAPSLIQKISHMNIGSMKFGKIRISGSYFVMDNVNINETGIGSILIESEGKATLSNIVIKQGSSLCLVMRGNAQVILSNFTINGNTIDHLETSVKESNWPIYPLLSQKFPEKTTLKIRPHQRNAADNDVKDNDDEGFIGLPWYWLPIMTVVGLISGMVVGIAMGCGSPKRKTNNLSSSLTFSDLIARDRLDEENRGMMNGIVGPHRPDLIRQDSGLTSSSFTSYTACADRRLSAAKHMEDFDHSFINTSDPNMFIHVPALSCAREDVIYEEVETLPPTREENVYVAMK